MPWIGKPNNQNNEYKQESAFGSNCFANNHDTVGGWPSGVWLGTVSADFLAAAAATAAATVSP